ncbi:prolipoprotein diacylglyceryl transferase [Bythopirellula polymerisocia]|uniref:Phosphatidylglycerol--prolipoprotein diacylglyceryl transferase n=1 Tax=Bythopirellula polymerisocia TaxID=2528003 RepID=A0A5C6D0P6_9BACT|nr:prolipoprotein diacylglyceryl transferase [Bythopirellula polymerisocia]TWU30288.1 Prolipoprotein diacylglyceryl transferase [Bythopirellula polymerisocia]
MCSELFRIPIEISGVPLLGIGVLLALWLIGGIIAMFVYASKSGQHNWKEFLPGWLIGALAIALLPRFFPEGLPLRGYGLMVLCGSISGILMAIHRGKQMGISADTLLSLAFGMFICGILGARLFYVIEYWDTRFQFGDWPTRLLAIVKFTEGGLVVYGALIGATLAFLVFTYRHKLPTLALADLIAPSLLIGLAFGRIGCLLNGCCYGGETDLPWGVTFPRDSLPYMEQFESGKLVGENPPLDASTGLPANLPPRSLPVHPTQIYSSIDAALLCWFLWSYYPFRRRDGEVTALMLTIHPISRFLLEVIRIDESAVFGTGLSISQNISIILLAATAIGWVFLLRQTPRRASFV